MLYSFDRYCVDVKSRKLRTGEALIEVEPQVFDILVYLHGGGRPPYRLRDSRRRLAPGEGGKLAQSPGTRLEQPGVEPSAALTMRCNPSKRAGASPLVFLARALPPLKAAIT